MKRKKILFLIFLGFLIYIFIFLNKPSLYKEWTLDQTKLSSISYSGDIISIKDIRNFRYKTVDNYEVSYYDMDYDLQKLQTLDFIVEPFSKYKGPAHTMLSFGFSDGKYLVVSAEIRKEVGESFNSFLGLLNNYELVYILGDEKDLISLRSDYRKNDVYIYPIKIDSFLLKKVFLNSLKKADYLSKKPEFYNTLTNNCITNILDNVNDISSKHIIGWSFSNIFPEFSAKKVYDLGYINTNLDFEKAKEYFRVKVSKSDISNLENYSKKIRGK